MNNYFSCFFSTLTLIKLPKEELANHIAADFGYMCGFLLRITGELSNFPKPARTVDLNLKQPNGCFFSSKIQPPTIHIRQVFVQY
jgi:hypothetical protein